MQKYLLLGASSGLGKSFSETLLSDSNGTEKIEVQIASRKSDWKMDFSKSELWNEYLEQIIKYSPSRIIYFAGGGPYGDYVEKNWQDHLWAFNVNFNFPAFLIFHLSKAFNEKKILELEQLTFIGSAIAESSADPKAASYAASKHALKGLITSLQVEKSIPFDLRLFSPGYMDTKMLPKNARPRNEAINNGPLVHSVSTVAKELAQWLQNSAAQNTHLILK